jgi:hypothetical protein
VDAEPVRTGLDARARGRARRQRPGGGAGRALREHHRKAAGLALAFDRVSLLRRTGRRSGGLDQELTPRLLEALPEDAKRDLARHGVLEPDKMWSWWPHGNDELVLMSVCAGSGRRSACGVVIARVLLGKPTALAWAEAGSWQPMLRAENDPRDVWLLGGDDPGTFRRRISYVWGRVGVGPRERRIAEPKTERGPKGGLTGGKPAGAKPASVTPAPSPKPAASSKPPQSAKPPSK